MSRLATLMESAQTRNLLHENKDLVFEASNLTGQFYGVLQNYIAENLVEFLDENLEETAKNIYTFSAYATKQYLNEIAAVYGGRLHQAQVLKEAARTEFV